MKIEDIDLFEINEAFASQALMSVETLKIPLEKVRLAAHLAFIYLFNLFIS
jgi:acetyl-CoA acyltransferase 1